MSQNKSDKSLDRLIKLNSRVNAPEIPSAPVQGLPVPYAGQGKSDKSLDRVIRFRARDAVQDQVIKPKNQIAADLITYPFVVAFPPGAIVSQGALASVIQLAEGEFDLTGENATIRARRLISEQQGAFSMTGKAATISVARKNALAQGAFSVTGEAAAVRAALKVSLAQGSFAMTGEPLNFPFTPPNVGGCVLWLRADLGMTSSSGNVATWADQSGVGGSNRTWAPAGTDKPALNTADSTYNNQATIGTFNKAGSNNDCRLVNGGALSTTYSTPFLIVVGHSSTASSRYFTQGGGSNYTSILNVGGRLRAYGGNATNALNDPGTAGTTAAPSLGAVYFNGTSSQMFLNSLSVTDATGTLDANTFGAAAFNIGSYPGAAATFGVERIAEVIVYKTKPSTANLARLTAYLNARYGTSWT